MATKNPTHSGDEVVLPLGLLGFERVKNYSILTKPEEDPFLWFQMQDNPKHAFLVVQPWSLVPDYQPDIDEKDVQFLELAAPSDAFILNTVTVHANQEATINLKGPIIINRRTGIGKQVIPNNAAQFPVRHPLPLV
jgi:flagellar assembly factor FliW